VLELLGVQKTQIEEFAKIDEYFEMTDLDKKGYVTFEDFKQVLETNEANSPSIMDDSVSSRLSLTHEDLRRFKKLFEALKTKASDGTVVVSIQQMMEFVSKNESKGIS